MTWPDQAHFLLLLILFMAIQVNTTRCSPSELLQDHYDNLVEIISTHLLQVTNAFYTKRLITRATKGEILTTMGISDYTKASRLMHVIDIELAVRSDPEHYLADFCDVLKNQQPKTLKDIGASIIQQLRKLLSCALIKLNISDLIDDAELIQPPQNRVSMNVRGGGLPELPIFVDDGFLDPSYNRDFRIECDDGRVYIRGGEVYHQPYGWYRFAMKVFNKYEDNTWLGGRGTRTASTAGEWPVSYHGTTKRGAEGIASEGYDINCGKRFLYGRGIYSSPDLNYAECFAAKFSNNGREYKIVFQNRVNPAKLHKANHDKHWITDDSDIRPYGILVKEI